MSSFISWSLILISSAQSWFDQPVTVAISLATAGNSLFVSICWGDLLRAGLGHPLRNFELSTHGRFNTRMGTGFLIIDQHVSLTLFRLQELLLRGKDSVLITLNKGLIKLRCLRWTSELKFWLIHPSNWAKGIIGMLMAANPLKFGAFEFVISLFSIVMNWYLISVLEDDFWT